MNLLSLPALAAGLLLAGCATPLPPSEAPAKAPTSVVATAAAPALAASVAPPPVATQLPSAYPSGPLSDLAPAEVASRTVAPLQPPADLWTRIRGRYSMPDLQTELVRHHEQWYASRPEYIQRMTDRSRKYLFHIVEELERRNMPAELALLPFIESAFNPQAVSSARAAGMWQFMPATGKDFDLKQNVFRDDRRDVLASTRAALDYLQRLHGMFGDWHLALAAYNWGEGSVGRAIARNQRAGVGTAYTDLNMPNETRNYVPKLQAVKNIVGDPERFRVELPVIENHPYFQTVTLTRDMDVQLAARLADVSLEDFKALNPHHHRPVILAAGTPEILLPWDNATVFKRNFEAYSEGKFASWTAWSVPTTLSAADAARRVGMTEAELRAVNAIPPRMLIKAGSVLIVPRRNANDDVGSHVADNGQLRLEPVVVTRRTVVKAGRNETISSLAKRYRVSPVQVAEWNDVGVNTALKVGQQVVLHLPVRAAPSKPVSKGARAVSSSPRRPAAKPVRR